MLNLRTEYTDIKEVRHKVEHLTVLADDASRRERIVEDLLSALIRVGKQMAA